MPADIRRIHLAHLALRTHADDICRGLAAMGPDDSERAAALNSLWNLYAAGLRGHDSAEDSLCWPVVVERDPEFKEIGESMDRQHRALEGQVTAAAAALGRLAGKPDRAGIAAGVEAMATLRTSLENHLADEEDRALPFVERLFTDDDMAAIERRRKSLPVELRALFLAAEEGAARRAGQTDLLGALPMGDRVQLTLHWRRRYKKLVGEVLAIR